MDGETRAHLARNVKDLRERLGLSQADLGRRADIAQTAVTYIERPDGKSPSLTTLEALSNALRVPLFALFLPELPADLSALRRADRLTRTYLAIGEEGRRTIDGIAEAEARYHSLKPPK